MVSEVDVHVGRVLAALRASGEEQNTVVLFWSDHGDYAGQYGLVEKWDTHFADCLLRVPCIIRAPQWRGGVRVEELSDHTDLCPTLAEILGVELSWRVHGRSMRTLVEGGEGRDAVFADGGHERSVVNGARAAIGAWMLPGEAEGKRFPKNRTYYDFPESMLRARMIRTRQHKMVIRLGGDHEFYDLESDPWELQNRWGDPATALHRLELMERLHLWALETDPDEPELRGIGA
jgi:choline-sulfatase